MAKILISGGSGLLGRAITQLFLKNKHQVVWLSRNAQQIPGVKVYEWNWEKNSIDIKAFENIDVLINLAGAGIVDKAWTNDYKKEIIDSRVESTRLLVETVEKNKIQLKHFIGASAVGYYGSEASEMVYSESSVAGSDFMAETCARWESAYIPFELLTKKSTIFRLGIVLSNEGGALPKMVLPFKYGFGASLGSGKQYFPWIHIDDLSKLFLYAVETTHLSGTFNAVAPNIVTNLEFSKTLAKSLNRPFFLPQVPEFMLKLFLGERHLALTRGLKISSEKLIDAGFQFDYKNIEEALKALNVIKTR
ncbi:MAG: TIGR01777 family oxidoreductase [Bacteroidota bacterium]